MLFLTLTAFSLHLFIFGIGIRFSQMENWLSARKFNFPFPQTVLSCLFSDVTAHLRLAGIFNTCNSLQLKKKKRRRKVPLTIPSVSLLTRCRCTFWSVINGEIRSLIVNLLHIKTHEQDLCYSSFHAI